MESRRFFATSLLALGLGLAATSGALAQSQPGDPPGLVGRLAEVSGSVSFHPADDNQWQAATLNYPVTSGNGFWTEPRSHAAIDVGAARIYLDSSTELDFGNCRRSIRRRLAYPGCHLSAPRGRRWKSVRDRHAARRRPYRSAGQL